MSSTYLEIGHICHFRPENPCESAFHGDLVVFSWIPTTVEEHDLILSINTPRVGNLLRGQLVKRDAIKWYLSVNVRFTRITTDGGEATAEPFFTSTCYQLLNTFEIEDEVNDAVDKIRYDFDNFLKRGSGWVLDKILKVYVNIGKYKPLKGSSYIQLPKELSNSRRGILNIQNQDNKCFMWSVLASIHPANDNRWRVGHYIRYEHELDLTGLNFPMKVNHIPKFKRQNQISVNVFGYESGAYPIYISKHRFARHVNLLLISQGPIQHYCLITNLDHFLSHQTKHGDPRFYCSHCLHGFTTAHLLTEHKPYCQPHGPQKIKMPTEENKYLKFTDYHHQLKSPFVIYADFESILNKVSSCEPDTDKSHTTPTEVHTPCGFCYRVVCTNERYSKPAVVYRGGDVAEKFLKALRREEYNIMQILRKVEPMKLSPQDEQDFQNATTCHICEKPLGDDKVRDHCHITPGYNFRGAAHNACNLNYKYGMYIPVVFHGLRNYDSHILMSGVAKLQGAKITCIPNSMEKYISFSINTLRFIDSFQFLNASLDTLTKNLAQEGIDKFPSLKAHFPNPEKQALLLRKGVYCYSYMDDESKFQEPALPTKENFFNTITQEPISDDDYHHAQTVWDTFQMKNLGDYHDLYLKTDVLLLEAIFENFRTVCLKNYHLDPAHYYTSPGLSWSAALRMTGVVLELLTDIDMHLFIENGIRGGVSMISQKYAKANHPSFDGYDPSEPTRTIHYWDCTNLYGLSMHQYLPQSNFRWLSQDDISNFDVENIDDTADTGYICEVDLEYPHQLHNLHSDYPVAPEPMVITSDMLSPYSRQLLNDLQLQPGKTPKLVPNLLNKTKYVLHGKALKQYVQLGLKLVKVHRILAFHQSPWLDAYITFNTEKRKLASNDFEKDFFKLMNNSVFGKTMENLRNHVNVELVTSQKRLRKITAKPNFTSFRIFGENLAAVQLKKTTLTLNRPIYAGMAILDISKTVMYNFHYNHIKPLYGEDASLLFTDTDSLCYQIENHDVYADMAEHRHLFDTSNFPTDHFLFSNKNKKVPGTFKDECPNNPPREFIGLKPKMYSLDLGVDEKKVAKGVVRSVIRKQLKHSLYKACLLDKKILMHTMHQIRSVKHQLQTLKMNKISLSPFDDKKYFISEVENLAHGHFKIPL